MARWFGIIGKLKVKIMNWIAKKLKKEEPQNSISRIQINKVDCCENCGDKNFLVTSELGISHRRIRLCKNCFKDLSDAINSALEDENYYIVVFHLV